MGDGVLAYFGFPRAHEEDAGRAVRAGLDIVAVVAKLDTPAKERLSVRIGVATGNVVVGDVVGQGSAQEQAVVCCPRRQAPLGSSECIDLSKRYLKRKKSGGVMA
jgi:class 3 adenylate cyclase